MESKKQRQTREFRKAIMEAKITVALNILGPSIAEDISNAIKVNINTTCQYLSKMKNKGDISICGSKRKGHSHGWRRIWTLKIESKCNPNDEPKDEIKSEKKSNSNIKETDLYTEEDKIWYENCKKIRERRLFMMELEKNGRL